MSDVFISYARSTAKQAQQVSEALRSLGYTVWIDDELPAHRAYSRVIEEQMTAARAAVVIWSADAVQSEWVLSEANRARQDHKLVQVTTDRARLPMPFDTIQCADLSGWAGDSDAPGWVKVVSSIRDLLGNSVLPAAPVAQTPPPLPSNPSIAVMPFANLSGDPEQEYFADGMLVEIVEALSRIRSIFVIASGSSLSFKGKGVSAQQVARQLGVRYVLDGSVRKAGSRVRIGVQLIDAADGAQIWTHRFEDTLDDVFTLQDKVALAVAGKIEPTVMEAEVRRAAARPTDSMGSYDLCLRALPRFRTLERAGLEEALELLNRAIALDPNHGLALSLAANCHWFIDLSGWSDDPDTNRRLGIERAHRASKAAGDDAHVLARAAFVVGYLARDPNAAVSLADRAIALNPGSSIAWHCSGALRIYIGDSNLAIEHLETAMRLDPTGPERVGQLFDIALARFELGQFSEAIALSREFAQHDSPGGWGLLAASYSHLAQTGAAREALSRYWSLTSQPIDSFARGLFGDARHLKLFLDGIALAEGRQPAGDQADAR